MAFVWMLLTAFCSLTTAAEIELLECEPPDLPVWGGYGPQQSYYTPGDVIHYWCDVDTYIGGNFHRVCEDTGKWSGDTPVCDAASSFSSTTQTSDADGDSTSDRAVDGLRSTCTETIGFERDEWYGNFSLPGELIRVMMFLPKGPVSYSVVLVKENGEELVCDNNTANNDRYAWVFHNCPGPHNRGATGLKIKSLTDNPLKICEIAAYVLTSPRCTDPHVHIENGRLSLNRKSATLICDTGYTRSRSSKLECIREGVWDRKNLYCIEREWEVENTNADRNPGPREPNRDAERLEN